MYYNSALEKTISYIEDNLNVDFALEDLTDISGFSRCHFSKLFHAFTGYKLSNYVRGRRLSEAAIRLVNSDDRIIDISFDYQFSSQESFTRSFNRYFSVSPAKYRKNDICKGLLTQIILKSQLLLKDK